jgi:hypothetical protein
MKYLKLCCAGLLLLLWMNTGSFGATEVGKVTPIGIEAITDVVSTPNGEIVAFYDVYDTGSGVEVWDIIKQAHIGTYHVVNDPMPIYSVKLDDSGKYLGIAYDIYLEVWSIRTDELIHTVEFLGDYAFHTDKEYLTYTTWTEEVKNSETVIFDLVKREEIAAFEYPAYGIVWASSNAPEIVVADPSDNHLFVLSLDSSATWEPKNLSFLLGQHPLKDVKFIETDRLLVSLSSSDFAGEYLQLIDYGLDEPLIVKEQYFPNQRLFLHGLITLVFRTDNTFYIIDSTDWRVINDNSRRFAFVSTSLSGSHYALANQNDEIEIYSSASANPNINLGECICGLIFTSDEHRWLIWDSSSITLLETR